MSVILAPRGGLISFLEAHDRSEEHLEGFASGLIWVHVEDLGLEELHDGVECENILAVLLRNLCEKVHKFVKNDRVK